MINAFNNCQLIFSNYKKRRFKIIIPIRCFSCGKLIAHAYKPYLEYLERGDSSEKAFEELGIKRFCCKRMIVAHVDLIDDLLKFPRLQ